MKRFGLTGGMGSGKSTVAKCFARFGAIVIDADEVARHVRTPGSMGHTAILTRFKTDDRAELRRILSESPEAKRDLEGILHPLIQTESQKQMTEAIAKHPNAPVLLYEATLLIEAGRAKDFDGVIVVTSPLPDRIRRISMRDQIAEKDAKLMIQAQNDDAYRLPHATYVIQNLGDENALVNEVRKVLDQIISA
jgi:dephospho-CoA kinase